MSAALAFFRELWRSLSPKTWLASAVAAVLIVAGVWLYLKGRHDAHAKDEAHQKIAVSAAVKSDTRADNKSAASLAAEAVTIDAKQKELVNAVAKIPDTTPDAVAVAAGCVELQRHGIRPSDLPACRAVGQSAGAGPHR